MKKIIALTSTIILTLFFALSFFPETAFAADATITVDGTYDISTYGNDSTITINGGLTVTLTNTTNTTFTNTQIDCIGANTNLTINGVKIDNWYNNNTCALAFSGTGNTLTLTGSSTLKSGWNEPGIRVESGTELEISGSGSVEARGGYYGAGIGGGSLEDSGIITISGGTVTAYGGDIAAGIGGGSRGDCSEINISGGVVNAYNVCIDNDSGAAIGGGRLGSGGKITITGGTITADSSRSTIYMPGAGIGCGVYGRGAEILITGGTVNASCSYKGAAIGGGTGSTNVFVTISGGTVEANGYIAGIGSGHSGSNCSVTINGDAHVTASGISGIGVGPYSTGCTVTIGGIAQVTATGESNGAGIGSNGDGIDVIIEGGTVFASGGFMDIGHGDLDTNEGTLAISGDSTVFFENDTFLTPTTSNVYFSMTSADSNGEIYEVKLPSGWTEASGYCSDTVQLLVNYNANGASGTVPDSLFNLMAESFTFKAVYGDGLSYPGATFVKWNTASDGSGTDIIPELTYTAYTDLTLYAIWSKTMVTLSLDKSSLSLSQGNSYKLTATYTPSDADSTIFWISSETSVATVDQTGNVTAVGAGSATITANTGTRSDTCTVTVTEKSVTSVSLNYGKKYMNVGEVFALTAIILPDSSKDASVTWDSTDYTVASVNSSGVVTARGVGICEITATAGGKTDTCTVSVSYESVAVESVSLSMGGDTVMVMYVGDTTVLSANVSPSNADDKSVTWLSSDTSIATVSATGKVTAVAAGDATITATASGKSDSYNVSVNEREAEDNKNKEEPGVTPTETVIALTPTPLPVEIVYTVQIDTTSLPYGAQYVELPNGEIVELNGEDTISCEVCAEDLKNGNINIIALDSDKNALGPVDVAAEYENLNGAMILLIVLGTLLLGVGGTLIVLKFVINKR